MAEYIVAEDQSGSPSPPLHLRSMLTTFDNPSSQTSSAQPHHNFSVPEHALIFMLIMLLFIIFIVSSTDLPPRSWRARVYIYRTGTRTVMASWWNRLPIMPFPGIAVRLFGRENVV